MKLQKILIFFRITSITEVESNSSPTKSDKNSKSVPEFSIKCENSKSVPEFSIKSEEESRDLQSPETDYSILGHSNPAFEDDEKVEFDQFRVRPRSYVGNNRVPDSTVISDMSGDDDDYESLELSIKTVKFQT